MPPNERRSKQQLVALVELARLGAVHSFADVTSFRLGAALGLSQQAASKRLIDLERAGFVERAHSGRRLSVRLTDVGFLAARSYYDALRSAFEENGKELELRGKVFSGFSEGAYYVTLKGYAKPFLDSLGFKPFPGTLNLRLELGAMIDRRRRLGAAQGIEVPGFRDGKRTFGPVKCFRALIGGRYPGAVLAIVRTHYDSSVLELISPVNLRKALRLKDGDECSAIAYLESTQGPRV